MWDLKEGTSSFPKHTGELEPGRKTAQRSDSPAFLLGVPQQGLKFGLPNVRFTSGRRLQVLSSLLILGLCTRDGINGKIMSQFLLLALMFSQCVGVTQLTLGFFFFKGNCPICSLRFCMFMIGGEVRLFLHRHLEQEPSFFSKAEIYI